MTYRDLYSLVNNYRVKYNHNKDCSEYAEDMLSIVPNSTLVTVTAIDINNRDTRFCTEFFNNVGEYVYHTVLEVKCEGKIFIIDVCNSNRVGLKNDYIRMLTELNPGKRFCIKPGQYDKMFFF